MAIKVESVYRSNSLIRDSLVAGQRGLSDWEFGLLEWFSLVQRRALTSSHEDKNARSSAILHAGKLIWLAKVYWQVYALCAKDERLNLG